MWICLYVCEPLSGFGHESLSAEIDLRAFGAKILSASEGRRNATEAGVLPRGCFELRWKIACSDFGCEYHIGGKQTSDVNLKPTKHCSKSTIDFIG